MAVNKDFAEAFTRMAERIAAVNEGEFSGALVAVSPDGKVVIEVLTIDPTKDQGAFWGIVNAKVEAAKSDFIEGERLAAGGGYRR